MYTKVLDNKGLRFFNSDFTQLEFKTGNATALCFTYIYFYYPYF